MSNYTRQKFSLGTVWGQTGDGLPTFPWNFPWSGAIATMLLRDRRPCLHQKQPQSIQQFRYNNDLCQTDGWKKGEHSVAQVETTRHHMQAQ